MPDRNDASQSLTVATYAPYPPNTDATDSVLDLYPDDNFLTGDQLAAYTNGDVPGSHLDNQPGNTFTKYVTTTTEAADYRLVLGTGALSSGPILIAGYNFIDVTNGATAFLVRLRDGIDAGAPIIGYVTLNSATLWTNGSGIRTRFGLFVEIVTGNPQGVIYTTTVRAD